MKSEKLAATKARLDAKLEARVDYTRIALGFVFRTLRHGDDQDPRDVRGVVSGWKMRRGQMVGGPRLAIRHAFGHSQQGLGWTPSAAFSRQ